MSYDAWERMRREANRNAAQGSQPRQATITGYNPNLYAVKVAIQPEAAFPADTDGIAESGWIPIATDWSGPGWGSYSPPSIGDQVTINHQEGFAGAGIVAGRVYDAKHLPLAVSSGEKWDVHQSQSYLKLTNDQKIKLNGNVEFDLTVGVTQCTVIGTANAITIQFGGTNTLIITPSETTLYANGTKIADFTENSIVISPGGTPTLTVTPTSVTSTVVIRAPDFQVT